MVCRFINCSNDIRWYCQLFLWHFLVRPTIEKTRSLKDITKKSLSQILTVLQHISLLHTYLDRTKSIIMRTISIWLPGQSKLWKILIKYSVTYIDNVDEMEDNWARGFVDVNLFKTCSLNYKHLPTAWTKAHVTGAKRTCIYVKKLWEMFFDFILQLLSSYQLFTLVIARRCQCLDYTLACLNDDRFPKSHHPLLHYYRHTKQLLLWKRHHHLN